MLELNERKPPYTPTEESPGPRRRIWVWALIIVIIAGLVVLLLRPAKKPTEEAEATPVVSVHVANAEKQAISAEVSTIGTIFPREEATVASKIGAQIKKIGLVRNKPVKAGDIVAVLESRDLESQRAEATAALDEARLTARNVVSGSIPQSAAQDQKALHDAQANVNNTRAIYERRQTLFANGGISKKDLEAAQLAYATAQNDLRLAETTTTLHSTTTVNDREISRARVKQAEDKLATIGTQLGYATVRAPFSGVITEQFIFQGEYAAAGAKMFTVADLSEVIVKAPVADIVASQLKVGDTAKVLPQQLPGEEMVGTISLVSRGSDPQNRAVEVWVRLKNENGRLRADGAAKVVVATNKSDDAVVVPAAAVTLDAANSDAATVMVVDEQSVAHERKVKVGIRTLDRMEITSGLKEGETVVTQGNYALPDGTKVQPAAAEEEEGAEKEGGGEGAKDESGGKKDDEAGPKAGEKKP
jgi:RND family efflux transporter MFP subunit